MASISLSKSEDAGSSPARPAKTYTVHVGGREIVWHYERGAMTEEEAAALILANQVRCPVCGRIFRRLDDAAPFVSWSWAEFVEERVLELWLCDPCLEVEGSAVYEVIIE